MTIGRFLGGRLVHLLGAECMIRYACWLGALGLLVGLFSESLEGAWFGFACLGFGLSNTVPILFSSASRIPGIDPGIGIAGVATLGYSGFLIGPPLIGTIAEFLGLKHALLIIVLFCVLIALLSGRMGKQSQFSEIKSE